MPVGLATGAIADGVVEFPGEGVLPTGDEIGVEGEGT